MLQYVVYVDGGFIDVGKMVMYFSRLNSLGIFHLCAKTNWTKNMHTIIAIVRSLKALQFIAWLTDNKNKRWLYDNNNNQDLENEKLY